jgi:hypothetical protein
MKIETTKVVRFLYLNSYAFLLSLLGLGVLFVPLYKMAIWLLALQIIAAVKIFVVSSRLFSAWPDKKRMMALLLKKNAQGFRPESFAVYMNAPCSRLLVRSVLKQLRITNRYRELLAYKEPFFTALKKNCMPVKTTVYIKENYI